MSGTNQSKVVEEEEDELDLEDTNKLNTCTTSSNQDIITAKDSNTEHNKLQEDTEENNLQLQIQEAIAATVSRASRKSIAFEQQQMNSSIDCTLNSTSENALDFISSSSEDQEKSQLRNTETDENCESSSFASCDGNVNIENPREIQNILEMNLQTQDLNEASNSKISDNLIQNKDLSDEQKEANHFEEDTAGNSIRDNVQNKQEIQEEKQAPEPVEASNNEISSREDMLVDSEKEANLVECSSNSHETDCNTRNLNNDEENRKISEKKKQIPEVFEACDSKKPIPIPEQHLDNYVDNSQSENKVDVNVESANKVEDTVVQTQEIGSVSSRSENDVDSKPTTDSAENQDAVKDKMEINVESSKKVQDTFVEHLQTQEAVIASVSSRGENGDSKLTTDRAENQDAVKNTAQIIENSAEDDKSKEPSNNILVNRDQASCSQDDVGINNIENLMEVQEVIEETLETQEVMDVSDSKMFTNEVLPIESEQENTSNNCISNYCNVDNMDISNVENTPEEQRMSGVEEAIKITSNEISSNEDFPTDINQTNQSNDSENDLSINMNNTSKLEENLQAQEDAETSESKMSTNEDVPIDKQESTSNNCISKDCNVDNIIVSNAESIPEEHSTSEETSKEQEAVEITSNEISSNKDLPADIKQTSQSNDSENVDNVNKLEENLQTQDADAETSESISTKATEAPDVVDAKSQQQGSSSHAISKIQDEDVFPVIEIVEEDNENQDVVEVIDVDDCKPMLKKRNVSGGLNQVKYVRKVMSKNHYTSGVCIEILSDEEEVQVEKEVEQNSEVQKPVEVDVVEIPKNQLEDILQQVKMLTSTEYLLFYLQLPPKWDAEKISENLSETLGTKLENNEIVIPEKNERILKTIDASVRETSKNTVQSIIDRVKDLTIKEYLWLRSNLPTDCINPNLQQCLMPYGSDISQTMLWLRTHLEEAPDSILLKHDVFDKYQNFCKQNSIHLMTASRFGKIIKQIFPKLGRKRLRVKGSSAYYYVGIQLRLKLDSPRLPNVSEKLKQKRLNDENESVKCVNKSDDVTDPLAGQPILENEYRSNQLSHQVIVGDEHDDYYQSNQLDGQTILVHDPLALLDISTNDDKLPNDASFHQSYNKFPNRISESGYLDKKHKTARSNAQLYNYSLVTYPPAKPRNSTSVINNSVRKVKYKEYRHPSVQKVFKQFSTIVLPPELFKLNLNPSVALDDSVINNWCAERLNKFAQKLSSIIITKIGRSQNFNVTFTCCNDVFEVSDSYAKQLNDLKEKFSDIVIRESENSSNYEVVRNVISEKPSAVPKSCKETFQITKQLLANQKIKTENKCFKIQSAAHIQDMSYMKHPSVQNLCEKFKDIVLPEEIFKADINPVIVLNSGEVIEWYLKQLDHLKGKFSNAEKTVTKSSTSYTELQVASPRPNTSSSRQSRAKMMNFCEIDSSDDDSDTISTDEYKPVGLEDQKSDILPILQTKIENPTVSMLSDCKIFVSEISSQVTSEVVDDPVYTYTKMENENVQRLCMRQKRLILNDEESNEIDPKRRRFYCSKITINPNYNASVSEQLASNNLEQIPDVKEKPVENCSSPIGDEVEVFVCQFCMLVFDESKELIDHQKKHLCCKPCKRKLRNIEAMREHLIKHCSLNRIQNRPILKLHRIDSVPSMLAKYARAFREPVFDVADNSDVSNTINYNEGIAKTFMYVTNRASSKSSADCRPNANLRNESMEMDTTTPNLNHLVKRTYSKLPRCTTVRIIKPKQINANSPNQTQIVPMDSAMVTPENQQNQPYQQTQPEPMFQLKNTISNNLNKILLLSNNVPQSQIQSPNILYGTLYVNNTSGQSSPNVCLNSPLYNPTVGTSGIDCAMNTNPSCSNPDLQQPPTFMQIVESPSTSVMQYAAPISQNNTLVTFEHQDHSYHQQQQLFQVGNNIPSMNNIVFVSNNPQITELQSTTVNTSANFTPFLDQSAKTSETEIQTETSNYLVNNTETSSANNPPPQGQFRIRVKSIQELR